MNVSRYNGAAPIKPARTNSTASVTPEASFEGASGLDRALANVPDVRPDAVARAKQLIASPDYPSAQNISQLSGFLARQLLTAQPE